MKVFFDTNVLVSAYAARGICADLVRFVLAEHEFLTGERLRTKWQFPLLIRAVAGIGSVEVAKELHEWVCTPLHREQRGVEMPGRRPLEDSLRWSGWWRKR